MNLSSDQVETILETNQSKVQTYLYSEKCNTMACQLQMLPGKTLNYYGLVK